MINRKRFREFQWLELPKNCLVEVKHIKTGVLYTVKNIGSGTGRKNRFVFQSKGFQCKSYSAYYMSERFELLTIKESYA